MKVSIFIGVMILAGAIVGTSFVKAQEPSLKASSLIIGLWKQNMEKSTYSPGPPPAKGNYAVRQYTAGEDGSIVAVTMNVDPQGLPTLNAVAAANYDGKEYVQYTMATLATQLGSHISPRIDRTISYKPLDAFTVQIVQKQDDRIVTISTRTISVTGRTMTEQQDFTAGEGQRIHNVLVFEKQ